MHRTIGWDYSVDEPVSVDIDTGGHADVCLTDNDSVPFDHIVAAKVKLKDNKYIIMTDYASAGKLWSEKSKMAVWDITRQCIDTWKQKQAPAEVSHIAPGDHTGSPLRQYY